jgi:hypothetical protein
MKRSNGSNTLYTCLKDVTQYVPCEMQIEVTQNIITYWMRHDGIPLLFLGGDWAGSKELRKLETLLRTRSLNEGNDYFIFPVNMTRYLGDVGDRDLSRVVRYDSGKPEEEGEYRIITTHPAAIRHATGNRKMGKTIFVDDWGDSYTAPFGFYAWAAEAFEDGFLNTESLATFLLKDLRGASQYAIVRELPENGVAYPNVIAMMEEKAPKLLNSLRKRKLISLIESRPEDDLAVDLERLKKEARRRNRPIQPTIDPQILSKMRKEVGAELGW